MPYSSIDELPDSVKVLPEKGRKIFLSAFRNAMREYGKEETAFKVAWAAVKIKYQLKDGKWTGKSILSLIHMPMYISKAVYKDDKMIWHGVASDTGLDLFQERTSVQLFKSFINRLDGTEYVSLSHYPSLDGKAELGKVTNLYMDGDYLKAKGYLDNNKLGIAAYNAIRKDRRDNTPQENRIRLSIGFLDYSHTHDDKKWEYKSGQPCMECMLDMKNKVYRDGKFIHSALTRIPARITTSIYVEELNK